MEYRAFLYSSFGRRVCFGGGGACRGLYTGQSSVALTYGKHKMGNVICPKGDHLPHIYVF